MADVIGGADIEIGADASGAVDDVERALGGLAKDAQRIGEQTADRLTDGIRRAERSAGSVARSIASKIASTGKAALSKAGRLLGDSLTAGLKTASAVAGTAIAGMLTNSLARGFSRLQSIDDAQAKLRGLRYTGEEIEGVMDSALASVRGTAFGLGDASALAATMLASGVEQGEELTRTLKLAADVATIAGTEMNDVGLIFGKVAASGKLTGETVQQLLERQIPIYSMLGDRLGKTQAEIAEMVSKGKIDFETFQGAVEDSIGGAALASADSFSGGLANLNAAFGRLGAAILEPAFQGMKGIFVDAIGAVDGLTDSVKPLVTELADRLGPALQDKVAGGLQAIGEADFSKAIDGASRLDGAAGPLIGALLGALGGILSSLPLIGGAFAGLTGPVGAVLGLIVQMWTQSETLRGAVSGVFDSLLGSGGALMPILVTLADLVGVLAKGLGDTLGDAINVIAPVLGDLAATALPVIADLFEQIAPAVTSVVSVLGGALLSALSAVLPVLGDLAKSLLPAVASILGALAPLLAALAPILQPLADLLLAVLVPALDLLALALTWVADTLAAAVEVVAGGVEALLGWFGSLGSGVDSGLTGPVSRAWTTIKGAVQPVVDWFSTHVAPVFAAVGDGIAAVWDHLTTVIGVAAANWSEVFAVLAAGWDGLWTAISAVWDGVGTQIVNAVTTAWEVVKDVAAAVWDNIVNVIETALGVIQGVISAATAIIRGDWSGAWNAVKGIADTIWGGLVRGIENVISTISSVFGTLKTNVVNSVSDAGEWLYTSGRNVIDGLTRGIRDMASQAVDSVKNVGSNVVGGFKKMMGIASPSKVFKNLGKEITRGLSVGITEDTRSVEQSVSTLGNSLAKAGESLVKAEADRLIEARRKANERIAKYNKTADKKKDLLGSLSAKAATKRAKKRLADELAAVKAAQKMLAKQDDLTAGIWKRGDDAGAQRIIDSITKAGNISKVSGLNGKVTLADLARARETVAANLDVARGVLDDMRAARADLAASVAESIRGELDLTAGIGQDTVTEWGHTVKGKTTFESVAGTVRSLAARAKTFADRLAKLVKAGIPAGLVQEVAALGSEQGVKVADALLSGSSAQVKSLASDYANLTSYSNAAGNTIAGQMYDVGIRAQEGLIKGLESDSAKLEKAAQKMTDKVVKAAKKALGIKSPSRLFKVEVGEQIGAGIDAGMTSYAPNLAPTVSSLVAPLSSGAVQVKPGAGPATSAAANAGLTAADLVTLLGSIGLNVTVGADRRTKAEWTLEGLSEAMRADATQIRSTLSL